MDDEEESEAVGGHPGPRCQRERSLRVGNAPLLGRERGVERGGGRWGGGHVGQTHGWASSGWSLGSRDHPAGSSLLQAAESLRNFQRGNARTEAVLQADDSGSWGRGMTGGEEGDPLAGGSNGPGVSLDERPGPTLWTGHGSTAGLTSQRPLD